MHYIKHLVGALVNFHSSEKYVDIFSSYCFILTHQVFKLTWCYFWVVITAVCFLVLLSMRWSITDEVNKQSSCLMLELESLFQGTNDILRLVTSSTGARFLNLLLCGLDIFSVLENIEMLFISFITEVPVANVSNSYFS